MSPTFHRWLWRVLWAVPSLLIIFFFLMYVWLPVDGATGDLNSFTPRGYEVQWVPDPRPGGLQAGDIVVRAGGHSYEEWLEGAERGPEWERGGTVEYEIVRDGEPMRLSIEMQPMPIAALLRHWGLPMVGGLGLLLTGSLVFWSRPDDPAACWFMLTCRMFALQQFADVWNFQFAIVPRPGYFWLQFLNEHLSYGTAFAALVIAAMTYPTIHPLFERHSRLIPAVLLVVFQLGIFGTFLLAPSYSTSLQRSNAASVIMAALYVIPGIALLGRSMQRMRDQWGRLQIAWMITVVAAIGVIAIPLYYVPIVLVGRPIAPPPFASTIVLLIPIAFAIAILRVKLYNIHFIINRSLVYGALTILLVALFAGSLLAVQALADALTGGQQSLIAIAVAAALFGALFAPARRRLQRFIDQRFFRIEIDYEAVQKQQRFQELRPKTPGERVMWRGLELEFLHRGGMAEIYRAFDPARDCSVAIKFLSPNLVSDRQAHRRFEREAQVVSRLSHPNIITMYEFGEAAGLSYLIMEFVEGPTLAAYLKEHGPMPLDLAITVIADVAAALDYIHSQRLVHRDIKPSNIILRATGRPERPPFQAVLADFGIAKVITSMETNLTLAGAVGTFDYMAPEQIHGRTPVDGRTDVYALGLLTYEVLTGERPFPASSPGPILMAHLQTPPPDPRQLVPTLPKGVAQAVMQAMAKLPADRFLSAGMFLGEIAASAAEQAASQPQSIGTPTPQ